MKVQLELDCEDLEPGDTRRMVCPKCNGGSSGEKSLVVTRSESSNALVYLCWRASCDARGAVGGSPSRLATLVRTSPRGYKVRSDPAPRLVGLGFEPITTEMLEKWEIHLHSYVRFGVMWDPETNRIALPVYSPVGSIRGWVLRALSAGVTPKTLAVPTKAEPQLGWNLLQGKQVVVVEDIPSAIRLKEFGVRAVALNGTHMTDEAKDELVEEAEDVVFALDRDAFDKSMRLTRELGIHFNHSAGLLLPKDFKNQNNNEVLACLASGPSFLRFSDPETRGSA